MLQKVTKIEKNKVQTEVSKEVEKKMRLLANLIIDKVLETSFYDLNTSVKESSIKLPRSI